jgi:hypothetical protein
MARLFRAQSGLRAVSLLSSALALALFCEQY